MDVGAVIWIGDLAVYLCDCTLWNDEGPCTYEVIYAVIKPNIYTSYWYNCVTELIWTECVDWCKIRYIFPLGNIYIHTHIIGGSVSYSDNWLEGQPAIRSELETQWWVLAPIPFPVVRRPNNSVGYPKKDPIVNGLVQGIGPCIWRRIGR